jgi:hypothetical protein
MTMPVELGEGTLEFISGRQQCGGAHSSELRTGIFYD